MVQHAHHQYELVLKCKNRACRGRFFQETPILGAVLSKSPVPGAILSFTHRAAANSVPRCGRRPAVHESRQGSHRPSRSSGEAASGCC